MDFPPIDTNEWKSSGHLPRFNEVIGAVRQSVSKQTSTEQVCQKVAVDLITHWTERNVYTKARKNVAKSIVTDFANFQNLKREIKRSKTGVSEEYNKFKEKGIELYDIYTDDKDRRKSLEDEHKVKMTKDEYDYLDSQRDHTIPNNDPRKMVCYPHKNDIDPTWIREKEVQEKRSLYEERQRQEMNDANRTVRSQDISMSSENESENDVSMSDEQKSDHDENLTITPLAGGSTEVRTKRRKKRQYISHEEVEDDPLPPSMRHIRVSENKVRDLPRST